MMPYPPSDGFAAPPQKRPGHKFNNKQNRGPKGHGGRQKKYHQNHSFQDPIAGPSQHAQAPACFNCGSQDHLIQNCPENHHGAPPGFSKHPRPPKRQRTAGGPMYGEPPQKQRPRNRSYTHPLPPHHPDYHQPPMPGPYESSAPYPAEHDDHHQWHYGPPPPSQYGYPPNGPSGPYPPMDGYGRHMHSPPQSYSSMREPHGYYPPPREHYRGEEDYRRPPGKRPAPPSWEGRRKQSWKHGPIEHTYPSGGPSRPWMPGQDHEPDEAEVWHPPNPVGRPLPSTLTDEDEISRLPAFASLLPGMSVSKYYLNKRAEEYDLNIRETEDWPFMMADPIFMDIPTDGEVIPISELIARRDRLFENHRVQQRDSPVPTEASEQIPPSEYERSYQEEERQEERQEEACFYDSEDAQSYRSPENFDTRSAASFDASPEEPNGAESYHSQSEYEGEENASQNPGPSNDDVDVGQEEEDRDPELQYQNSNDIPNERMVGGYDGHDSGYVNENQNNRKNYSSKNKQFSAERHQNGSGSYNKGQSRRNQKPRHANGNGYTPKKGKTPGDEANDHAPRYAGSDQTQNSMTESQSHFETPRPTSSTREPESHSKSGKQDGTSGSVKKEPRRQMDDTTPKIRSRQPRVAEAYSRRW